jgi:Bardet-Biedl syndrome 4 protein
MILFSTTFQYTFPFTPQAISCLKKSLWLSPLSFNALYNLGVVLMTAQQFASAFQCFVSAVSYRPDNAESFMMLASM